MTAPQASLRPGDAAPAGGARPLALGSLCTGYGGLDMAVAAVLPVRLVWVADNDAGAAAILAHHHPDVPNLGDFTATDFAQVEPVDVLAAGFPCQDLSYAGHGAGITEGTRSGLWFTIADAIRVLRPRLVFLENVRAIVSRRPGLDVVLADLARLGFDAEWTCLRASAVGASHERKRWFLAAAPRNAPMRGRDGVSAPERGGEPARPAGGSGVAAADAQGTGWERPRPEPARCGPERSGLTAADAARVGRNERWAEPAGQQRRPDAAVCGGAASDTNGDGRAWGPQRHGQPEARLEAPRRADGRVLDWGAYGPAIARWERVTGRAAPDPTEPGRDGKPRLSPLFVEWLMGLPAGHVTAVPGLSRNQQLKALGNGVVPQQATRALAELLDRTEVG